MTAEADAAREVRALIRRLLGAGLPAVVARVESDHRVGVPESWRMRAVCPEIEGPIDVPRSQWSGRVIAVADSGTRFTGRRVWIEWQDGQPYVLDMIGD